MSIQPMALKIRGKKLGLLMRAARQAKSKSLQACAQAMGIAPEKLESYELGEQTPSLPEIELLAYALGLPVDYFWGAELPSQGDDGRQPVNAAQLIALRQRVVGVMMRKARLQANTSPEMLAERLGISPAQLEAYEQGETPIPLTELEALAAILNVSIRDFQDRASPVGQWFSWQHNLSAFKELPADLQTFVTKPVNRPYLELAQRMSEMSVEKLRMVAEVLLEITL